MTRTLAAFAAALMLRGSGLQAQESRPKPTATPPPAGAAAARPEVDATQPDPSLAGKSSPAALAPKASRSTPDGKAEIRKTIEARKARKVRSTAKSRAAKEQQAALAKAQADYRAKMAPLIAAAENPAIRRQLEAQAAQALQQMARGAIEEAEGVGRAIVEEVQRNGIPQGLIPNGIEAIPGMIGLPR